VIKKSVIAATIAGVMLAPAALAQAARDYISIVGSSTVFPFTSAVAEQFGKAGQFKTPKVESTGTGGGMKLFCAGVGVQFPDATNASRRMKQGELDGCRKNGVNDVVEIVVGFDGIAIANAKSAPTYRVSRKDIYLALAKQVPDETGQALVANPYKTWKQVNPSLPDTKIEVLGPPPTSGTRDSFVELVMEKGCETYSWLKELKAVDERRFKKVCGSIREDGAYIEAGENDNLIVQKLNANPRALGIFGYSFLEENLNTLHGSVVEGVAPEYDTISSGKYPISRALYIYIKKAHVGVIPGLKEFIAEYTSDKAMGEDGYLADKGLVASPKNIRDRTRKSATALDTVKSL
jgi:phosphate transport system substrate-binding protein